MQSNRQRTQSGEWAMRERNEAIYHFAFCFTCFDCARRVCAPFSFISFLFRFIPFCWRLQCCIIFHHLPSCVLHIVRSIFFVSLFLSAYAASHFFRLLFIFVVSLWRFCVHSIKMQFHLRVQDIHLLGLMLFFSSQFFARVYSVHSLHRRLSPPSARARSLSLFLMQHIARPPDYLFRISCLLLFCLDSINIFPKKMLCIKNYLWQIRSLLLLLRIVHAAFCCFLFSSLFCTAVHLFGAMLRLARLVWCDWCELQSTAENVQQHSSKCFCSTRFFLSFFLLLC